MAGIGDMDDPQKEEDHSVGIMSRPDDMDDASYDVYSVQRRSLRRYWFCHPRGLMTITGGLALLCLAIGLGVSLSKKNGASDDSSDSLRGSSGGAITLPPPSLDLSEVCSGGSLGSEEGFQECEEACDQARCCLPSSDNGNAQNCFTENARGCLDYDACLAIFDEDFSAPYGSTATVVDPDAETKFAAKAIEQACNSSDMNKCEDLCSAGKCCFQPDVECAFSENEHCEQFTPCTALDVLDDTFSMENWKGDYGEGVAAEDAEKTAYDALSGACREDDLSRCRSMCDAGLCCYQEGAVCDPSGNSCDVYLPCTTLRTIDERFSIENFSYKDEEQMTDVEKFVPEGLSDFCNQTDLDGCAEMCKEGRCCFEKDVECGFNEKDICGYFLPCTILQRTDETFAAGNLDFGTGSGSGDNTDMQIAPIKEACDPKNIRMYGVEPCKDLCSSFACCYMEGEDNCLETNDGCDDLGAPCSVLFDGSIDNSTGEQNDEGPTVIPIIPIEEICKAESIKMYGKETCQDACEAFVCCFQEGGENCKAEKDCDGFAAPCAILFNSTEKPQVDPGMQAAPIREACDPASIEMYGLETCQDMCDAFQCCFEQGGDGCGDAVDCTGMGAPCAILYNIEEETVTETPFSGNGDMQEAPIKEACQSESIEMYGKEPCLELCAAFECCFQSGDDNCADTNDCKMGAPCSIFYGDLPLVVNLPPFSGEGMQEAPIREACDQGSIEMYGRGTCEDLCYAFECCFQDGEGNCGDQLDCDGMGAPCSVIYGELPQAPATPSGGGPPSVGGMQAAPIKEACSPESIEMYTDEMCKEFCMAFECCFKEGDENCEATNDCEFGAPCNVIYGTGFADN